jgi:hypothetical protein
MKIKTNIYHVTADNGLTREDRNDFSTTIHAKNEDEAVKKGVSDLSSEFGLNLNCFYHGHAVLIYKDVVIEVVTPEPLKTTIADVDFTYDYESDKLTLPGLQ